MARSYNPSSLYVAPTLVIGVGGTGVEIMRLIKANMSQSPVPITSVVQFLALDTEPCDNLPGQETIFEREFAYIGDYNASSVLKNLDAYPHIKDWWFDDPNLVTGSIYKGARQRRYIGRLSLYVKWGAFIQKLIPKTRIVREISKKEDVQRSGINVERDTGRVQVYIISSVCGGTGSGVLLDVAFRVRQELGDDADIGGVLLMPSCFLPEIQSEIQQQRIQANAYATLREMNHFMGGATFHGCFPDHAYAGGDGRKIVDELERPFDWVYLVDRSNGKEHLQSLESVRRMASQYIYLDIATPIGKVFAARRDNLRDLASEHSQTGPGGQKQPLFVSGFVTASLIMPVDKMTSSLVSTYSTDFIKRRIGGRQSSEEQHKALAQLVETRLQALDALLRFEKKTAAAAPAQPQSVRERLLNGGGGNSNGNGSTPQIDLSDVADIAGEVLQEVQRYLHEDFLHYGLHGVLERSRLLAERLEQRRSELDSEITRIEQEVKNREAAKQALPPKDGSLDKLLAFLFGGQSPAQRRKNEWMKKQAAAAQLLQNECTKLERSKRARATVDQLHTALSAINTEIARRVIAVVRLLRELSQQQTAPEAAGYGYTNGHHPHDGMDLFELATEVGNEPRPVQVNGTIAYQSFLESRLRTIVEQRPLGEQEEEQLLRRFIQEGLFRVVVNREEEGEALSLEAVRGAVGGRIHAWTTEALVAHGQQTSGEHGGASSTNGTALVVGAAQPRIVDYIDWFHANVNYDSGESRNTQIDPLLMLRRRCSAPFLEIDETRIGAQGASNTQDVRLLGVDVRRDKDPVTQRVLRDFDMFEDVPTAVRERLDISFSRHGYAVSALRDLKKFRDAYRHFCTLLGDKMHIHRDWPQPADEPPMDDLL